jgi:adenylate cyclase
MVVDEMSDKLDNLGDDLDSVKKAKDIMEKKSQADKEKHLIEQQKSKEENEKIEREKKIANERLQLLTIIMIVILVAIVIGLYLGFVIWKTNKTLKKQKDEIERKNGRIEELILNILPREVAEELSQKGSTETRYYDFTTVFFADIKGFSALAKQVTPQQLIAELDRTFGQFDEIIRKYNLERIKTIGDCYMCAGGVPNRNKTNPFDVVLASLEIQKWMEDEKAKRKGDFWEVRIGAHTGDLVAGVIGKTKFAYDIWGNTVNLASRMESVGVIGKVNISHSTYQIVKDFFDCTPRGEIEVKNMGSVATYFVDRIKPQYSADAQGYSPNAELFLKIK